MTKGIVEMRIEGCLMRYGFLLAFIVLFYLDIKIYSLSTGIQCWLGIEVYKNIWAMAAIEVFCHFNRLMDIEKEDMIPLEHRTCHMITKRWNLSTNTFQFERFCS